MRTPLLLAALLLPLTLAAQQTPAKPAPNVAPAATPAQPSSNNTQLTGAVMEKLITDPILQDTTITVAVSDKGAVTLNGVVARQQVADRAVAVAKSVPGVTGVTSNILVSSDPFAPPKPALPSPLPPIAAAPPAPPAANSRQAKLADALAKTAGLVRVDARVYDNQVLLFGTVETKESKAEAEKIARGVLPKVPITNIIWVDAHPLSPPPLTPQ
ncbi:MAG: BON domain-containing protein [Terriglobales bacterium]